MKTKDPRPDIIKDHALWADVLDRCSHLKTDKLIIMMQALRNAECSLWIEDKSMCFSFNKDNLDSYLIQKAKEILKPYKTILNSIFKNVVDKHNRASYKNQKIPF